MATATWKSVLGVSMSTSETIELLDCATMKLVNNKFLSWFGGGGGYYCEGGNQWRLSLIFLYSREYL